MADTRPSTDQTSNRFIFLIIILIIVFAAGTFLYAGWIGFQETPKLIEVRESLPPASDSYSMSPEQEDNLSLYGYPEAFTILFYEEETSDRGVQTVRLETWDYYSLEFGLTFANGELVSEDPLEIDDLGSVAPIPYSPDQFSAFMSLENVIAAAGIETYIEVPLNKEFIDEGNLYFSNSLSFGLQNNQLVYIEALALIEN